MSKEVIKFKCGHEVEVWVSPYKGETEEHWRERQEGNLCPDCYREFKWQEKVSDAKRCQKNTNSRNCLVPISKSNTLGLHGGKNSSTSKKNYIA